MGRTSVEEFEVSTGGSFMDAANDAQAEGAADGAEEEVSKSATDDTPEEEDGDSEELEASDEESEEDDSEEGEDEEAKPKASSKKYAITDAEGAQVKVDDSSTVKIKVDGSYERVSVADLVQNYNGRIKHDELIRRSAEAEKAAEARLAEIQAEDSSVRESLSAISSAISEGNIMDALTIIGQMSGDDASPEQLRDRWTQGLTQFIQEWEGLSDEQREAKTREYQLRSEVKGLESKKKKLEKEDHDKKVNEAIDATCEEFGLTRDELQAAWKNLEKIAEDNGVDSKNITLLQTADRALSERVFYGLSDAANELGVTLDDKDVKYLITTIRAQQDKDNTRLSGKDYEKIITAYAKDELDSLNRKVEAEKRTTTPKRKKENKTIEVTRTSQLWD